MPWNNDGSYQSSFGVNSPTIEAQQPISLNSDYMSKYGVGESNVSSGSNSFLQTNVNPVYSSMASNPVPSLSSAPADTSTGDMISAGGKLAAFIPTVGPILASLGEIGGSIANYFAQKDAAKAAKDAQDQSISLWREQQAEDTRRYDEGMGLQKESLADNLKTSAQNRDIALMNQVESQKNNSLNRQVALEEIKLKKEKQKMDSMATAISNLTIFMNTPQTRGQFIGAWGGLRR
jgi:hypothetical protein